MDDCLFCKIIAGDIPSKKVYEDDLFYAFDDIEPEAPVHTLVVPKQHYDNLQDDVPEELLGKLPQHRPRLGGNGRPLARAHPRRHQDGPLHVRRLAAPRQLKKETTCRATPN